MGRLCYGILCLSSVFCYWNGLNGDMVFDDIPAIITNKDVRPSTQLGSIWLHDFWGTPINLEYSHKSYRPLCVFSFRLNYLISGENPWSYHLFNIILHAFVSVLFHRLCETFLKLSKTASNLAALLFSIHPIHTEAVSSIVGRAELLSAVFYSLALILISGPRRVKNDLKSAFLCSILFALLGCLSKEQCFAFFPLAILYVYLWDQQKGNSQRIISILITSSVVFLSVRLWIMGGNLPRFSRQDNPLLDETRITRLLTKGYLSSLSAWICLFPYHLCCDWTSNSLTFVTSLLDYRNAGTAFTIFIFLALFKTTLLNTNKNAKRNILILAMIIIPYLPTANWFFPVGFVIAERVLYLPSMGICALVAEGATILLKNSRERIYKLTIVVLVTILILSHVTKTIQRNIDWSNEFTLYKSGLRIVPNNTKLLNNYGKYLEKIGNYTESLLYYQKAMSVKDSDIRSYVNAGSLLHSQGQNLEAEIYLEKAVSLIRENEGSATMAELKAFIYLANVLASDKSRLAEASLILNEAISLRSDFSVAYIQKGELLLKMNRSIEAAEMFKQALNLDLHMGKLSNPNFLNNYGALLLEMGQDQEAFQAFSRALALNPDLQSTHVNLALLVQETISSKTRETAIKKLQEITFQDEKVVNETTYFRLGMLALDRDDKQEAKNYFEKALNVNPTFRSALYNLALLLIRENQVKAAVPLLKRLIKHHPYHANGMKLLNAIYESH